MLPIETYRDGKAYRILDEVRKLYDDAQRRMGFKDIGEKNKVVNTVHALSLLSFRLGYLCQSILSLVDFYAAAIIYRALIEHSLKHTYLFVCCMKDGDATAKEYVSSEHMSHEVLQTARRSRWPHSLEPTAEQKRIIAQLGQTAKPFRFAEVARQLLDITAEQMPDVDKALRQMMVQYSKLSSYVHAGPMAVLDPETKPKANIDMSSVLLTIIAYNRTIQLLSSYPSNSKEELEALYKVLEEKVGAALRIYEEGLRDNGDHPSPSAPTEEDLPK